MEEKWWKWSIYMASYFFHIIQSFRSRRFVFAAARAVFFCQSPYKNPKKLKLKYQHRERRKNVPRVYCAFIHPVFVFILH